jgi:hypothetical protein
MEASPTTREKRCAHRLRIEETPRDRKIGSMKRQDVMNGTGVNARVQAWVVDYSAARMRAISWLGERYLLAKPINARAGSARKPVPAYLRPASQAFGTN